MDVDGDGFGDIAESVDACEAPDGYVANDSDCDDTDPAIFSGADESWDDPGIDNDCDGNVDEDTIPC